MMFPLFGIIYYKAGRKNNKRNGLVRTFLGFGFLLLVMFIASCGGGAPHVTKAAPGSYTVTVNADSTNFHAIQNLTVVVQ